MSVRVASVYRTVRTSRPSVLYRYACISFRLRCSNQSSSATDGTNEHLSSLTFGSPGCQRPCTDVYMCICMYCMIDAMLMGQHDIPAGSGGSLPSSECVCTTVRTVDVYEMYTDHEDHRSKDMYTGIPSRYSGYTVWYILSRSLLTQMHSVHLEHSL